MGLLLINVSVFVAELRDKLEVILGENKQIAFDLETAREQLCQTRQEVCENTLISFHTACSYKCPSEFLQHFKGDLCQNVDHES